MTDSKNMTYAESGVDISAGDKASKIAYQYAMKTFASREGMIGAPMTMEGGFSGALDFGKFLMVMNCDGVGTKIDLAIEADELDNLGYDLLAMVSDDAVCVGAEVMAITNTIDTNKVDPDQIERLMKGLSEACIEQRVGIPGGEIAELGDSVKSSTWNSTAIGIVDKDKFISGEKVEAGDVVIALQEKGFRSNGFSLVRYILKQKKISLSDEFEKGRSWGKELVRPSTVYHNPILALHGSFGEDPRVDLHGVVHITGGGLAGNLFRILKKKGLGADLPDIFPLNPAMLKLQELGGVEDREVYKTWNGGNGMLVILSEDDVDLALEILEENGIEAKVAGKITDTGKIVHKNFGFVGGEESLEWGVE